MLTVICPGSKKYQGSWVRQVGGAEGARPSTAGKVFPLKQEQPIYLQDYPHWERSWEHWVQLAREAKTKGPQESLQLLLQLHEWHRAGQLICLIKWHYVKRKSMIYPLLRSFFGRLRSATADTSVCAHVEARGGRQASCSVASHLIFPGQGLSLHLELGCWLASPSNPPVSAPHSARFTSVPRYTNVLHESQGFKLSPL